MHKDVAFFGRYINPIPIGQQIMLTTLLVPTNIFDIPTPLIFNKCIVRKIEEIYHKYHSL